MPKSKVDRLSELNKIWFKLHTPKVGDKVKFKIRGENKIHEGEITEAERNGGRYKFQMVSKTAAPTGFHDIIILESNGIKFRETNKPTDQNDFKPI